MEWDGLDLREGFKLLEDCYERLMEAIKDETVDPKEISSFVEEAEHIVVLLTNILQKSPIDEEAQLELIKAVKAKADAIIQVLHEEMETIAASYEQLKTGKRALNAYQPQPVGLGYSEGKFVDRKK
ncbi:MAG TPA: hypothetical protein GXZ98_10030 [Firmicutes bacterium]|jgi:hypothetical protein|nr:hypothetical protein [Bacillota bacterium]